MSELLALEWEHDQVSGVQAQVSAGRVRIRRCFTLTRPNISSTSSAAVPVGWLQTELGRLGIGGGEVLVALPRDEVVVKRLELPETSDDELPVLVRYQAAAKSSVGIDELRLDFIPLPRRNEVPGREVLMATVPQQTITEVSTLCELAGLKLAVLGLTPAAVAELVARAESPAGAGSGGESLVVARHGHRLEISVLRRCHLLFSHSARLTSESGEPEPQAIVAEVSRALVALRGAIADVKIERAWTLVSDREREALSDVLKRRLSCEVQPLELTSAVEWERGIDLAADLGLYAGPIGLLLSRAEPRVPAIDFLSPRKPPVKRDLQKRRLVIAGVAAGVAALLFVGAFWWKIRDLDAEIADLTKTDASLKKDLEEGAPILNSAKAIEQWEAGEVPWLDEVDELARLLPPGDRIYLTSITLKPKIMGRFANQKTATSTPSRILIKGYAREQSDVLGLSTRLHRGDKRYAVQPPMHTKTNEDNYYPWKFESEILVHPGPVDVKNAEAAPGKGADAAPAADRPAQADESKAAAQKAVQPAGDGSPRGRAAS